MGGDQLGGLGRNLCAALAFVVCAAPLVARGEEGAAEADADAPQIELSGKVSARAEADQRLSYERSLSVPRARFQVKATFGIAQAVIEADIASTSLIKDAYLRLSDPERGLRLYAGQFKAPFLQRELLSSWDLPFIERGLVDDYLVETNSLGGRRIGLMGEYRNRQWLGLEVQLGAFEGGKDEFGQRMGQDLSARATLEPIEDHLEVGTSGYWADAGNGFARYAGGADATVKLKGASLTAEGLAGRIQAGTFTAQILTARYLFQFGDDGRWGLEPAIGAEALQLRGPISGAGRAAVLGLNVHYTERVKLTVQGERGLFPGDQGLQNRFAVQLAARF